MRYTEAKTVGALKSKKIDILYKEACINWSGKTQDTQRWYTEIISESLLKSKVLDNFKIKVAPRLNYKRHSHAVNKKSTSNREEEIFAKILNGKKLGELGEIIDYQVPLKATNKDKGIGKIDLISLKGNVPNIIELKYADNAETLLRSALEIWTYYHQLHKENFINSFKEYRKSYLPKIRKALILVVGCKAYKEALDLKSPLRKNLRKLIKTLDVDIFLLDNLTKVSCN